MILPTQATQWTRWFLPLATLLMGMTLVFTGLSGYRQAQRAAEQVTAAQAADLLRSMRQELWLVEEAEDALLAEILVEYEAQGLRYIAILQKGGALAASAGRPEGALDSIDLSSASATDPRTEVVGSRVRATARMGRAKGGKSHSGRGRSRGTREWRLGSKSALVLEFEPLLARDLVRGSISTLVVMIVALALLIATSAIVWRLTQLAERSARQLQRERHLASLGEMSAVLGHEIRNPLTSLKGHAQLLVEKLGEDHPVRAKAERVVNEAVRLEQLTNEILLFVRSGQLEVCECDPREVAREAASQVDSDRVTVLDEEVGGRWPMDKGRMQQVLVNLLRNGLQASPPGMPVELSLSTGGERLEITVRDHGAGIALGAEHKVFEPFHTDRVHGTGLGLTIARRIVEGHGGRIEAGNHPEGGAVFRIVLEA